MPVPQAALDHYRRQQLLTARTVALVVALWRRVDPDRIAESWDAVAVAMERVVTQAQLSAVVLAVGYVPDVLDELGVDATPVAGLRPTSLAGVASDGRPLGSLLYSPVAQARAARYGPGGTAAAADRVGREVLSSIVATQVQDAGRVAVGVSSVVRPAVTGHARALNLPSCSRCIVLAGRVYRYSRGFDRHPLCDCVMVPVAESVAGDATTSPAAAFSSLTPAEQDRAFTKAGAQAIRDGADPAKVVNARRGMTPASVFGRDLLVTSEGVTRRRGSGPRLMPESIYSLAQDRADAVRLLRRNGYIT